MKSIYLNPIFYYIFSGLALLYIFGFFFPVVEKIATILLCVFLVVILVDFVLLFSDKEGVKTQRILPEKLSNGDVNPVQIYIKNLYRFPIKTIVIDELPFQFQTRDFEIHSKIKTAEEKAFFYKLKPKERGEYTFGGMNIYVLSPLRLVARRFKRHSDTMLKSYPSFIHLPEYELLALKNEFLLGGVKKIRKLGQALEFEQIKEYVIGDDIRTINWKATGKRNQLMVNQYQEERSQRIYMLIDKGRTMQMPFDNFSLLDYSINASMALSHIVLKKKDHPGVMTFAKQIENQVSAGAKGHQLKRIADTLYNIETNFVESDFGRLYADLRKKVTRRSLILLFSNFETLDALKRQLPYLRAIAKNHLLVVVFFKNSEVKKLIETPNKRNVQDVYDQIVAEKFEYEKKLIRYELMKYGIQSVYTLPENLSVNVINKYIEVKARGLL
ncbi:MAG: DUF58 domain-containing protein [Flavobacteriaceae bacterium]|nr:DUF58 domain-containing protein [Flavobacteriaceae bacterium]